MSTRVHANYVVDFHPEEPRQIQDISSAYAIILSEGVDLRSVRLRKRKKTEEGKLEHRSRYVTEEEHDGVRV
jgi:hypothetical protein